MSQIVTRSGRVVDVLAPSPADIDITDIAHALSHLCRWCGHSRSFYSVAQHSVLVSRHVSADCALWGLLHDAAEAYVMDVPSPIKAILGDYAALEERMQSAILHRYKLLRHPQHIAEVKEMDKRLRATEAIELGLHPQVWGGLWVQPLPIVIKAQPPEEAKKAFLARWKELGGEICK